jgi:ubiquinone/menaquinone biosynthesis C-methylase UbiE
MKPKMVWNKIAKDYEGEVLSLTKISKRREQILKAIRKGIVLNLGTGSMPYLNKDLIRQGNKVVATDYSRPMLKAARHSFSHANLEYKLADNKKLSFKDNIFDSVISINSTLPEKRQEVRLMIKEVWRVLRPTGKFVAFLLSKA